MRRQTNFSSIWSTSSASNVESRGSKPLAIVECTPPPPRPARRVTGRFLYVIEGWSLSFDDLYESVIDERKIYFDQVKITGGFGPVETSFLHDFFDGTRLYIADNPTLQPDDCYRSMYTRKMDQDHFEIRQSAGTFVLKSLSATGTKVNGTIVPQGETVVLSDRDRIEDRIQFELPSWSDIHS